MHNLPLGQSYLCGEAREPLLYETIGACLDRIADQYPDREALVVRHQSVRWTFAEYREGCWRSESSRETGWGSGPRTVSSGV